MAAAHKRRSAVRGGLPGLVSGDAYSRSHRNHEREARELVEAARDREWKLPSFGKELFLGNFSLDLIHPQPPLDPHAVEGASASWKP